MREIPLKIKKSLANTDKNDIPALKERVIEYCKEPRSIEEIKNYIGFETTVDSVRRHLINPLMKDGKLKYTHAYNAFYCQRYIDAKVEVTQQMLDDIKDKADGVSKEYKNKILEYCKTPKGFREIQDHIGTKTAPTYIRELVQDGKLKLTFPDIQSYCKQQYFNAEYEYEQFTDQAVADYCIEPRTKAEIEKHFNLTIALRKGVVQRLLDAGKICYTKESEQLGICDGNRRLVQNG